MNMIEAKKIIGRQPKWAIRNMQKALEMMTIKNTPEDWRRLTACYVVMRVPLNRRVKSC